MCDHKYTYIDKGTYYLIQGKLEAKTNGDHVHTVVHHTIHVTVFGAWGTEIPASPVERGNDHA